VNILGLLIEDLSSVNKDERRNIFRRYFAASRYNRLLIQQVLVRSAIDSGLLSEVKKLEERNSNDFFETLAAIKQAGYFDEFIMAVQEEDDALQKIIEAYDKRRGNDR
jgi:tRNA A37 N6-isopentenylltransferase MiaA